MYLFAVPIGGLMQHPETHLVTAANGIAPAGMPDACFWCSQAIGGPHAADCVCRKRTVIVEAKITYAVVVPQDWDKDSIESHRNGSSWCANNCLSEIERALSDDADKGRCACDSIETSFVREASAEEEKRYRIKGDLSVQA